MPQFFFTLIQSIAEYPNDPAPKSRSKFVSDYIQRYRAVSLYEH